MPETDYRMPEISPGEACVWYPAANKGKLGYPALVAKLYLNAVCLYVYDPERQRPEFKEGVKHVTDPEIKKNDHYQEGGWDYSPSALRLRMLEDRVAKLEKCVPPK